MPDYYPAIRAAKYLGGEPWALYTKPKGWILAANMCEQAEEEAREERRRMDADE